MEVETEIETETEIKLSHLLTGHHRCTLPWRDRMLNRALGLKERTETELRADRKVWAASIFYGCYYEIM